MNKIEEKIKINKSIMRFNDYELNILPYNKAIKYDKRSFSKFYLSLLKTRHILMFSFCPSKDYNSRIIKIYLFFYSFAIYLTVNALFFDDNTINKIYEDYGAFNFIYKIPIIIYSSIISSVLTGLLKTLSLSERNILKIKNENKINHLDNEAKQLFKWLHIKFIIFFFVSFLFLSFFWYYLSCFCAIYINTQIHLLKDTVISFFFSMLYQIGLYILPGIFRILALRDKNKKKVFLYKFSIFIQSF